MQLANIPLSLAVDVARPLSFDLYCSSLFLFTPLKAIPKVQNTMGAQNSNELWRLTALIRLGAESGLSTSPANRM